MRTEPIAVRKFSPESNQSGRAVIPAGAMLDSEDRET